MLRKSAIRNHENYHTGQRKMRMKYGRIYSSREREKDSTSIFDAQYIRSQITIMIFLGILKSKKERDDRKMKEWMWNLP